MMRKTIKVLMAVLCVSLLLGVITACKKTETAKKTKLDSPVITSKEYTGSNQTATVAENEAYEVTVNEGGTDVGEYDVVLTLTDTKKYEWATPDENDKTKVTLKFSITKATNEITVLTLDDWAFGETPKTPTAEAKFGKDTVVFTYATSEDGEYMATIPSAVGKYWVKATVEGTDNYTVATKTAQFEIKKAAATVTTAPAAKTLAYTGSAQELVTAGVANGGTLNYKLGEDGEWGAAIPTATDAGEYKVYYKVVADDSHSDTVETELTVNIAKANAAFTTAPQDPDLHYNGEAQELVTAGVTNDGTVEYKLGDNGEWSETIPTGVNATTYKVYYRIVGDKNHNDLVDDTLCLDVTIARVNSTYTTEPTAAQNLVYTGADLTLAVAGEVVGGKLRYSLDNNTWAETLPTAVNAGEYTVYYEVEPDANHTGAIGGSFKVVIAKAAASVTVPTAKTELVYNGNAQALANAGSVTDATLEYKLGDGEWTAEVPTATNAGEYTVYYRVTVDDNHTGATDGSFKVVIAKAQNELSITITDIKYGEEPQPTLTAKAGEDTATFAYSLTQDGEFKAWDKKANRANRADEHYYVKATVEETENYLGASKVKAFTVHKADNSLTDFALDTETVKCGTEHDLKFTVNKTGGTVVIKFGKAENGQFAENIPTDEVGNGLTYYAMAFVENDDCYVDAHSNSVAFTLTHNFVNGICSGCNHAQTNITYVADGDVYGVKSYNGRSAEVYPLSVYEGKPVTFVANGAFKEMTTVKKVVLPESVTELRGLVFFANATLEYLSMPGVTTFVEDNNIHNCLALKTLIVKEGLNIPRQQMQSGDASKLGLTSIFVNGTKAITVENPDLNKMIGTIYYKGDATKCLQWNFDENGNVVHGATAHNFVDGVCTVCAGETAGIEYTLNSDGTAYTVTGYKGTSAEVYVRAQYNGLPVTAIGDQAFMADKNNGDLQNLLIKKVVLPNSVNSIGGDAFFKCAALEYIEMKGIRELGGGNAFINCYKLKTVVVGSVFNLSGQAFKTTDGGEPHVIIYVYGTADESTITAVHSDANNMFTGTIRYYSDTNQTGCWHYENGVATLWN